MNILAFLQNSWFKPGTDARYVELYRTDQAFHRRVLYGSMTGRALRRAFGSELYGQIIWENASPRHGQTRDSRMPHDLGHMAARIIEHRPHVILCFGREAEAGMRKLMLEGKDWNRVFFAPHPMARGSAAEHLREIVIKVREIYAHEEEPRI